LVRCPGSDGGPGAARAASDFIRDTRRLIEHLPFDIPDILASDNRAVTVSELATRINATGKKGPKSKVRFLGISICLSIFLAVQEALPGSPGPEASSILMGAKGIVDIQSKHSAVETVARLESLLKAKGIKIFEAKAAGLAMRPTVLLSSAIRKPGPL
jgi:hypothetical protein